MTKFIILVLALISFTVSAETFYSLKDQTIDGKDFDFSALKGKVVMVVNIASQCGFTVQLEDLQKLNQKYQGKDFVVLGVPSNEFGGQTPESDQEMKEFCSKKYSVTFPLLKKGLVNGKNQRALYKFLTVDSSKNMQGEIGWNFVKFIVDKNGKVIERYSSSTNPTSVVVTNKIDSLLK